MSTSANIRHLRATKSMTQEQLAMLVGVSRQAIAKWEAGGTYPETEKLIRLSQIFECSLDDIITGDLTSRPIEAAAPAPGSPQDICGYDQAMRSFAMRLACGAAIILLAIGVGLLLESFVGPIVTEGVICLAFALAGVAAGVAVIVPACIRRQTFNREHPFVEDFYTTDDRAGAGKLLGWGSAAAWRSSWQACFSASYSNPGGTLWVQARCSCALAWARGCSSTLLSCTVASTWRNTTSKLPSP